jgi:hypothetical protein
MQVIAVHREHTGIVIASALHDVRFEELFQERVCQFRHPGVRAGLAFEF